MRTNFVSAASIFVLLLAIAIGAAFALAFDVVRGVNESGPLGADIERHRLVVPAELIRIPYEDLHRFMTHETQYNIRANGRMRTSFTSTQLALAMDVFGTMFEDEIYVNQFRSFQDEGRATEVDALRGYLSVTLGNKGDEPLSNVVLTLPGARFARVALSEKDEADVRPLVDTDKLVIATLPAGATVAIDAWLDNYQDSGDWSWTNGIELTHSEGTGDIVFHQLVSPMFERFDRNPLIALASATVLLLLAFAVIVLYVVSLVAQSGRTPRSA